ncbi:hypothetical protein KY336_03820 [Candidatus Woesearchaeota archaeon]|nr:hypothetical protein [Candidatus Woesearchaeota archaeon]
MSNSIIYFDEIDQESLDTLVTRVKHNDELQGIAANYFKWDRAKEFYEGLFAAYNYIAALGLEHNPESNSFNFLNKISFASALILDLIKSDKRIEPKLKANQLVFDRALSREEIAHLTPNFVILTEGGKGVPFKLDKSPVFYHGLISGYKHSWDTTIALDKRSSFEQILGYTTCLVVSTVKDLCEPVFEND